MNPKVINSLNARLSRIEAMLENSDVFKAAGGTTYGGLQYQGSQYNYNFEAADAGSQSLDQQMAQNYGFGPSDMAIFELQQRIAELELLVAGGSNDIFQGGALDAGQAVGDDGEGGTGEPVAPPEVTAETLGLGTMAYQEASAVAITGGTASLTSLAVLASGASVADLTANATQLVVEGEINIDLYFQANGSGDIILNTDAGGVVRVGGGSESLAFNGGGGATVQTITGSRGGNAALANLLTGLANYGLIINNTSA